MIDTNLLFNFDTYDSSLFVLSKAAATNPGLLLAMYKNFIQNMIDLVVDDVVKDVKRRTILVKFLLEWIEKLESEQIDTSLLESLLDCVFKNYFTTENSNEVNAILLEILPYYKANANYFIYVKQMAT